MAVHILYRTLFTLALQAICVALGTAANKLHIFLPVLMTC